MKISEISNEDFQKIRKRVETRWGDLCPTRPTHEDFLTNVIKKAIYIDRMTPGDARRLALGGLLQNVNMHTDPIILLLSKKQQRKLCDRLLSPSAGFALREWTRENYNYEESI